MSQSDSRVALNSQLAPAPALVSSITPEQIEIVKSLTPLLGKHATAISTVFYEDILNKHPALKNMFSLSAQQDGSQPRALAESIIKYVTYIDQLAKFNESALRIAHKHASLQVEPGMYDIVGPILLKAIGTVLGDVLSPEAVDAWNAAYGMLASAFIKVEDGLRDNAASEPGGWVGWRDFRVAARKPANESGSIVSFTLEPVDGQPLPAFEPGQYISVRLLVAELGLHQNRQYSLSKPPDYKSFEISVKRIDGNEDKEPGLISNLLHGFDVGSAISVSQPQGEFTVRELAWSGEAGPLVLLSAGVGATPLKPMLTRAAMTGQQVVWLHGSHDMKSAPFWRNVQSVQERYPANVRVHLWLAENKEHALDASEEGQISVDNHLLVEKFTPSDRQRLLWSTDTRTGYYICGPKPFMMQTERALLDMQVSPERIHMELFSTGTL